MSASVPHLLDTVFPESPIERRVSERQGPDSRENLNANTVKELQDLEMGEEDQNATVAYDHKLITAQLNSPTVEIIVSDGKATKSYWIHKGLICGVSPVFETAFNGNWKENNDQRMDWNECSPRTFDIFVHWLYTTQLPRDCDISEEKDKNLRFLHLLKLADVALIPDLETQTYQRIRTSLASERLPSRTFIQQLYDYDWRTTQLRVYIAKICVYFMFRGHAYDAWEEIVDGVPQFGADVSKELRKSLNVASAKWTTYHSNAHSGYNCSGPPRPAHPFRDGLFEKYGNWEGTDSRDR